MCQKSYDNRGHFKSTMSEKQLSVIWPEEIQSMIRLASHDQISHLNELTDQSTIVQFSYNTLNFTLNTSLIIFFRKLC